MNPSQRSSPRCRNHPLRESIVRCGDCSRSLCDECYRHRVNGRPTCARCAYECSTRTARRLSLAVSFLCICAGGALLAERRFGVWNSSPVEMVIGAVAALGVAAAIALSGRAASAVVENRDPDEPVAAMPTVGGSAYRASARRVLMAASPRISGRATALVMLSAFGASAAVLPASLRLPRWVETELVLALWWLIVAGALTTLLYRGFRLRDDFVYFSPWNRPAGVKADDPPAPTKKGGAGCADGLSGCSGDGEGLVAMVVLTVVLGVALGAAWLLVEITLPLVFFLMYWLFMRAIGRVANDRHGCEGALANSLGWGVGWATVYVAPIAIVTWALHALHR